MDIIYLCFPNNPTGVGITRKELKRFVDYAKENKAIIFYDAAYEEDLKEKKLKRNIKNLLDSIAYESKKIYLRRK